jgi:Gas vesicle synthesis protein GvpL/GvpF
VGSSVYLYGVVRSGALRAAPAEGVADSQPELLEREGLAALVSKLPPGQLRPRRRDLKRHLQALEETFAQATVVPCPFGTVLPSEEAVTRDLLETRRDELLDLLDRLEGHVQMNVKAAYEEGEILREIVSADPEIARLRRKTTGVGDAAYYDSIRLGELVSSALEQRRRRDAELVLAQLLPEAVDAVLEQAGDLMVAKASFLVEQGRVRSFDDALEALATSEAPRLRFECFGPLPPTAFATLEASA